MWLTNNFGWRLQTQSNKPLTKSDFGTATLILTKKNNRIMDVKGIIKCDCCGKKIIGKYYPIIDENYNVQEGLKQCKTCYAESII